METREKITSREQFGAYVNATDPDRYEYYFTYLIYGCGYPWYRARDEFRYATGEFRRIPSELHFPDIAGHSLHVSNDDPLCIAYCPNEEYAQQDRFIRSKPGRYLTKFSNLGAKDINTLTQRYVANFTPVDIELATTEAKIEFVYESGPRSCMKRVSGHLRTATHPTRCYATPDLAVAYIRDPEGEIVARTVIRADTKQYVRLYGNVERFEPLLTAQGYTCSGSALRDARLLKLRDEVNHRFLAPYVDGNYTGLRDDDEEPDKYWRICDSDDGRCMATARDPAGYLTPKYASDEYEGDDDDDENLFTCEHCGERYDADEAVGVYNVPGSLCSDCVDANCVNAFYHGGEVIAYSDDCVAVGDAYYIDSFDNLDYYRIRFSSISDCYDLEANFVQAVGGEYGYASDMLLVEDADGGTRFFTEADLARAATELYEGTDGATRSYRTDGDTPLALRVLNELWTRRPGYWIAGDLYDGVLELPYGTTMSHAIGKRIERIARQAGYELDDDFDWVEPPAAPQVETPETYEWRIAA